MIAAILVLTVLAIPFHLVAGGPFYGLVLDLFNQRF